MASRPDTMSSTVVDDGPAGRTHTTRAGGAHAAREDRAEPRPRGGRRHPLRALWLAAEAHPGRTLVLAALLSAVFYMVNLSGAPDFSLDETAYALAGRHIGLFDQVTFATDPVRVHPPLFFLATAGWLGLFGKLDAPVLDAIHTARYLNALFDIAIVLLTGVIARLWTRGWNDPAARGRAVVGAMALVSLNGFLLRFGRNVLIEPMAVAVSLAVIVAAWKLRHASMVVYATVVGGLIGLAVLTKMPTLFLVAAPLLGALIARDRAHVYRHLVATVVGGLFWCAFPLWAVWNGDWAQFFDTQTLSIRRLLGLLQVTGLNRPGASPLAALRDTFWQYAGSYLTFLAGAAALAVGLVRWLARRGRVQDAATGQLLGLGVLSFGFVVYSVVVGQSNEQLSVYTVPAAALLALAMPAVRAPGRESATPRRSGTLVARLVAAVGLVAVVADAAAWTAYFPFQDDTASAKAERWIQANVPVCAPINATADVYRWQYTLRTNPVAGYGNGPEALAHGVHWFLVSPKDARFFYGASSPALVSWIESHGTEVFHAHSHTNESISLWRVGTPISPDLTTSQCVPPIPDPTGDVAPASRFLVLLGGAIVLDLAVLGGALTWQRRRADRAR